MNVLIACEFSGVVRDAFIEQGHNALSCDLLPTDVEGPHYQGNILDIIDYPWDLMISHPPCTHLATSGARHFKEKWKDGRQALGVSFFMSLIRRSEHIPKVAIENPVCIMSSLYRKPDQVIHPWMFGDGEVKATCLWLKNLPFLVPTDIVEGRSNRIHMMPGSKDQAKKRSITYSGIAKAMAQQWSV